MKREEWMIWYDAWISGSIVRQKEAPLIAILVGLDFHNITCCTIQLQKANCYYHKKRVERRKRKREEGSFIHTEERREVGDGIGVTTDDVAAAATAQLISLSNNTIRLPILLLLILLYPHSFNSIVKKYLTFCSGLLYTYPLFFPRELNLGNLTFWKKIYKKIISLLNDLSY